ncbi:MAG: hypothetical protein ACRCSK_05430 [Fusobacteriaceae bacterium]
MNRKLISGILLFFIFVVSINFAEGATVKRPATKRPATKKATTKRTTTKKPTSKKPTTKKTLTKKTTTAPTVAPIAPVVAPVAVASVVAKPVQETNTGKKPVYIYFKGGADVMSSYSAISGYSDGTVNGLGMFFDAQLEFKRWEKFEIGVGASFQIHPDMTIIENTETKVKYQLPNYNSVPVYLAGKFYFLNPSLQIQPYIFLNAGYSFNLLGSSGQKSNASGAMEPYNYGSYSNGPYVAGGLGAVYKNFTFDVMYAMNMANYSLKSVNEATGEQTTKNLGASNYSRISIGIGYRIDLARF